ncbi:redox-regulated ATPase YchF [bacterium]|nr:redox-regulated ATPase YchF [bacterium]
MGFKCGIVGLPNVGKSTIFNAITAAGAEAANYPFCTIEPNVGMVEVPDERLNKITELVKPKKTVPAIMEFVDIAGLVKGASKGEGLGNQFLGHIKSVDAIAHVVRCFEDSNVTHVDGEVNPLRDIGVIDTELALKDLETLEKNITRVQKLTKSGDKDAKRQVETFVKFRDLLNEGKSLRSIEMDENEKNDLKPLMLITGKPVIFVANVGEKDLPDGKNNAFVEQVRNHAKTEKAIVVVICGKIESELSELEESEKSEFLADYGLSESGLNQLIQKGYSLLGLQTYFTAGEPEARAWTIHVGDTAPKAAGVIHTDFERGFISAETISYEDFLKCNGSRTLANEQGLMRKEGKNYVVKDGDVILFRFNV